MAEVVRVFHAPATSVEGNAAAASRGHSLNRVGTAVMALGAVAWTCLIGALAVWRHHQFLSHRFDLGNMVQAVWSTTEGRPLEVTDYVTGEQTVRLAGHVDPILVLLSPLWWIHPGPETLLVAQAAVLATGIYPVVRLGLKYTRSSLAAGLLGAWYLAFPWIVWNAVNDLHPVTFAIPLLLFAIWFLDEHRVGLFAVFALLAIMSGELVGLAVAGVGIWHAVRCGWSRFRPGLTIAAAGVAWTALCLTVIIPLFNNGSPSGFYRRFESVGGSPGGLVTTLFTDPSAVVAQVATGRDLLYVLWLVVPTGFLALGQPLLLVPAAPQLGVNLLSDFPSMTLPVYQYVAPVIASLVAASIMTIGRLPERARVGAAGLALASAVVLLVSIPPVPGAEEYVFGSTEPAARVAAMREAVDLVPPAVPVTATNRIGAHLSARRTVHLFPTTTTAGWAVIDTRDRTIDETKIDKRLFALLLEELEHDTEWQSIFDREDVRVYRRQS